jgi:ABC-2 type transport system ATP-binding protein
VAGVRRVSVIADELPALPGVVGVQHVDGRTDLLTPDADELVRALVRADVHFRDLRVAPVSLEDAFLSLVATPAAR